MFIIIMLISCFDFYSYFFEEEFLSVVAVFPPDFKSEQLLAEDEVEEEEQFALMVLLSFSDC